jgi:uncharacterized small protein (DUF1192 family)
MSEIVKRLLAPAYWISGSAEGHEGENNAPREAADEITRLIARLREEVAWHEADKARFHDVQAAHLREITRLKAEVARLKTCGIVEVAAHNPSVMDWIKHWEDRTLKAEAVLDAVRRAIPDAYILDPPDGGDVSTVEGVTRLKEEVARLRAALEEITKKGGPDLAGCITIARAALTPSQEPRT